MTDNLVRSAFHQSILKPAHDDPDTVVLDEFALRHGESRADIAVLNGKLVGYEIKTEEDSLTRLKSQITAYSEVFDRAYLISGKRHLDKISVLAPDWWGIYEIEGNSSLYSFSLIREGKANPKKDSYGIAHLLWKDEAIDLLVNLFSCKVREKSTRDQLYNILIDKCSSDELSKIVIKCLKSRSGWRTNPTRLL
jgi:hypothetical protein